MSETTLGPTVRLSGPAPSPPRYSLLAAATIIPDPDLHYLAGAQIWPYPDARSGNTHNPCASGTNRVKSDQQTLGIPTFASFTAYITLECTARALSTDYDIYAARAVAALEAAESFLVEREISRGLQLPLNPHFADATVNILLSGAATGKVAALAALEQSAARTGVAHWVHVDPATATVFASEVLVEREAPDLRVVGTGSRVIVGTGYVSSQPSGGAAPSATTSWAYATGPIEIRRSEIFVNPGSVREAMDRGQNDITLRAERYYLAYWDDVLHDAVLVNRAA